MNPDDWDAVIQRVFDTPKADKPESSLLDGLNISGAWFDELNPGVSAIAAALKTADRLIEKAGLPKGTKYVVSVAYSPYTNAANSTGADVYYFSGKEDALIAYTGALREKRLQTPIQNGQTFVTDVILESAKDHAKRILNKPKPKSLKDSYDNGGIF